jgi:hypothetical protein
MINLVAVLLIVLFIDHSCVVSYEDKSLTREYIIPPPEIVGKKVSTNGDSLYIIRSVTVDEMISYRRFYREKDGRYEP